MEEPSFLTGYDPAAYARPSITVNCVLLGVAVGRLCVLLTRRTRPPFAGRWALPGGFVGIDESLEAAATRVLGIKAGLADIAVEQVHAFGTPNRDPRMRIVAIAHCALLTPARLATVPHHADQCLATIDADGSIMVDGDAVTLAFDHADIIAMTIAKLRRTIDDDAFALVPDHFTLRELQAVHEAVLGRPLNKPAFRRRMLERGALRATGAFEAGRAFRPAELYVRVPKG